MSQLFSGKDKVSQLPHGQKLGRFSGHPLGKQKRERPKSFPWIFILTDPSLSLRMTVYKLTNFVCFPPSHLGNSSKLDCTRFVVGYLLSAVATSTAQATVQPTIGLLPMPRNPIISTCAGTDEEPANCASECIRPIVSVILSCLKTSWLQRSW